MVVPMQSIQSLVTTLNVRIDKIKHNIDVMSPNGTLLYSDLDSQFKCIVNTIEGSGTCTTG